MKTYNQFVSHLMSEGVLDMFGLGGESPQERWLRTGSFAKPKPKPKPRQSVNLEPYKKSKEGQSGLVNLEPYETKQKSQPTPVAPKKKPVPPKDTKPKDTPVVADRTPTPKPFVKQTGDKAKDMATWAKANPTAVASEKKRKASFNPLMDRTFGYQTGGHPKRSVTTEK